MELRDGRPGRVPQGTCPGGRTFTTSGRGRTTELPDYGSRFDVAIIPYRLTTARLNANPIKLREYLAMGKPIVSVSTPEIDKYADVVRIGRTPEEFLAHLDRGRRRGHGPGGGGSPGRAGQPRGLGRPAAAGDGHGPRPTDHPDLNSHTRRGEVTS